MPRESPFSDLVVDYMRKSHWSLPRNLTEADAQVRHIVDGVGMHIDSGAQGLVAGLWANGVMTKGPCAGHAALELRPWVDCGVPEPLPGSWGTGESYSAAAGAANAEGRARLLELIADFEQIINDRPGDLVCRPFGPNGAVRLLAQVISAGDELSIGQASRWYTRKGQQLFAMFSTYLRTRSYESSVSTIVSVPRP